MKENTRTLNENKTLKGKKQATEDEEILQQMDRQRREYEIDRWRKQKGERQRRQERECESD